MSVDRKSELEVVLGELYDIRHRKSREEKLLQGQAHETKKDINLVTLMFSEGIPDLGVSFGEGEYLTWDARSKRLIYTKDDCAQFVEGARNEILVRIRPYLKELVAKAKAFYV